MGETFFDFKVDVYFCFDSRRGLGFDSHCRGGRSFSLFAQRKPNQKKRQPMLALRVPCASQYNWAS
jgi:hypothetical protein